MTEQTTPPTDAPDPAAAGGAPAGQPPSGFVSEAELERERQRARTFQAELDRTKAQLAAATAEPPKPDASGTPEGFDPQKFSQELLSNVYRANTLVASAAALQAEFPKADPSLFSPEKLATYGSVDALRIVAEADHNRVVATTSTDVADALAKQRAELVAAYGAEPPGGATGTGATAPGGDPSVATLAAMSMDELAQYEKDHPGVADRVLRAAA
jgi:hypothetical protein